MILRGGLDNASPSLPAPSAFSSCSRLSSSWPAGGGWGLSARRSLTSWSDCTAAHLLRPRRNRGPPLIPRGSMGPIRLLLVAQLDDDLLPRLRHEDLLVSP